MDLNIASWNRLANLLRQIEALRRSALPVLST